MIAAQRTGNKLHTTEKPLDLIGALMSNLPFVRSVYDPFAGSGTTLIAAEQTGRICYGMEIDPGYCDVIRHRYAEFIKQAAE